MRYDMFCQISTIWKFLAAVLTTSKDEIFKYEVTSYIWNFDNILRVWVVFCVSTLVNPQIIHLMKFFLAEGTAKNSFTFEMRCIMVLECGFNLESQWTNRAFIAPIKNLVWAIFLVESKSILPFIRVRSQSVIAKWRGWLVFRMTNFTFKSQFCCVFIFQMNFQVSFRWKKFPASIANCL